MIGAKVLIRRDGIITMKLANGRLLKLDYEQAHRLHPGVASGLYSEGYIDGTGKFVIEYVDAEIINEYGVAQHKAMIPYEAHHTR